jgi:hypothetical protein
MLLSLDDKKIEVEKCLSNLYKAICLMYTLIWILIACINNFISVPFVYGIILPTQLNNGATLCGYKSCDIVKRDSFLNGGCYFSCGY